MPTCKVGLATGGELKSIEFLEGADVGGVLYVARVTARPGDRLMLKGKPVGENHPVHDGDILLVSPPITGA